MGGSGLTVGVVSSGTRFSSSVGISIAAASSFLGSVAGLFTNGYWSKPKMKYTKPQKGIILTTILYENTLRKSLIDEKIDEIKSDRLKKI